MTDAAAALFVSGVLVFLGGVVVGHGMDIGSAPTSPPVWAEVPPCPDAGLEHHSSPGHNRDAYSAYLAQGWTNVSYVTVHHGGPFSSGESYSTQADCPIVHVNRTGGAQ